MELFLGDRVEIRERWTVADRFIVDEIVLERVSRHMVLDINLRT